jgi:hypothetical protein
MWGIPALSLKIEYNNRDEKLTDSMERINIQN